MSKVLKANLSNAEEELRDQDAALENIKEIGSRVRYKMSRTQKMKPKPEGMVRQLPLEATFILQPDS